MQVETFRGQTRTQLLCLKEEVGAALAHFNGAVDRFNHRVNVTDRSGTSPAEVTLDARHPNQD